MLFLPSLKPFEYWSTVFQIRSNSDLASDAFSATVGLPCLVVVSKHYLLEFSCPLPPHILRQSTSEEEEKDDDSDFSKMALRRAPSSFCSDINNCSCYIKTLLASRKINKTTQAHVLTYKFYSIFILKNKCHRLFAATVVINQNATMN